MRITKIERQKKSENRLSVFIDGKFSFGITEEDAARHRLKEGAVLTQQEHDALIAEVTLKRARFLISVYLSYSDRTEKEVRDKLRSYGEFDDGVITAAIESCKEYGYIDDVRYAQTYAEARSRRLDGPVKIRHELISRGIDPKIAGRAVSALGGEESESAAELLRKRAKAGVTDYKEKRRLYNYLSRKGYSSAAISEAFGRIADGDEGDWSE